MAATPLLDRPAARLGAALLFLLCVAALAYLHRNDFRHGPAEAAAAGGDPVAACMHDRIAVIDAQLKDGILKPEQAQLFRARVDALCQAQSHPRGADTLPPGMTPTPLR